jgi:glycosyltransferase involved in cell wall biosynthesis
MNKIIALLPFRNEEKFIPSYLSTVRKIVDEIIAIDDQSDDKSAELLRAGGATVYTSDMKETSGWAEFGIRQKLLELGRKAGGTHFVVLDADETFTGNFVTHGRQIIEKLEPGQRIQMQWLAMWKSVDHYKDDESVWSNNFKDFIFRDDGKMQYPEVWMHTPRTPGPFASKENSLILNPKYGAIMHFQFSDWDNFQIKQCWLRCSELLKGKGSAEQLNQKYAITLDQESRVSCIQESWKNGVTFPEINYQEDVTQAWRFKQMKEWFETHGCRHFEKLQIWHQPQIAALRK